MNQLAPSPRRRGARLAAVRRSLRPSLLLGAGLVVGTSCSRTPPGATPEPAAESAASTARLALPAVPLVQGPLAIRVVYPPANAAIPPVDSNFVFGTIGNGRASLTVNGQPARVYPNGSFIAWLPLPGRDGSAPAQYELVAATGNDTARLTHPIRVNLPGPASATAIAETPLAPAPGPGAGRDSVPPAPDTATHWLRLGGLAATPADTDRVINVRPISGGTYKWFLLPGTQLALRGRSPGFLRVQLDSTLDAWVPEADAAELPAGTAPPRRVAGNIKLRPAAGWVDVVIPVGSIPPYLVEARGNALELTLYGTQGTTDVINFARNDSLVRNITWEPVTSDRVRYTLHLAEPAFGWLALQEGGSFVLRVRRPPRVADRGHPLRGLTIAVDPGHPPIGATGPSGLWEPQATLPIGQRLRELLEARGARVVMTRTTMDPVDLLPRTVIARRADAHAFVSVHLNALPDGQNPFVNAVGSGTYFFRPQSEPLARAVQRFLPFRMGLADNGVYYDNLAVVRPTWYPAVLCEGAYIMMPDQEAALRTPEYQERYARAIADGLEAYFRELGR